MTPPSLLVATTVDPFFDGDVHHEAKHPVSHLCDHVGGLVVCPASFRDHEGGAPRWLATNLSGQPTAANIISQALSLAPSPTPILVCDAALASEAVKMRPQQPFIFAPHSSAPLSSLSAFEYPKVGSIIGRLVASSCVQHLYFAERLKFPPHRIELIPDAVDTSYFRVDSPSDRSHSTIAVPWFEGMDLEILSRSGLRHEADVILLVPPGESITPHSSSGLKVQQVDTAQRRELLRRAGAVLVPSPQHETSIGALQLLESMAMAAPIVLSNARGLEHLIIPEHEALVYKMEDPSTLRAQVHRLLSDEELVTSLSANARVKVENSLTNRHFAERMARLLRAQDENSPQFYLIPAHLRPPSRGAA